MAEGYVQGATDGTGKKVEARAITVPAGTQITDSDGTITTLTADAVYYRQVTAIADEDSGTVASVYGETDRGALSVDAESLGHLEAIHETLREIRALLMMALGD